MSRRISETVEHEVYSPGSTDSHGNEIESWAPAVELGIYAFNPGGTSEPITPGQDRVITTPTLYVPTGTVVSSRDRITVAGEPTRFEVDGDLRPFRNPYDSSMDGCVVNLKAVSG